MGLPRNLGVLFDIRRQECRCFLGQGKGHAHVLIRVGELALTLALALGADRGGPATRPNLPVKVVKDRERRFNQKHAPEGRDGSPVQ
jgi:hypothetical protein